MITLIATIDMDNGIGNIEENQLYEIPKSKERLNYMTKGNIVVVGRKTFDKLPKSFIDGRKIIVMSNDINFNPIGVQVVNNIDEVLKMSLNFEVYVIGGEQIFNEFIKYADTMLLTQVYDTHKDSYYYFPDFTYKEWKLEYSKREEDAKGNKLPFGTTVYKRIITKEEN